MEWNGMEWNGMELNGTERNGIEYNLIELRKDERNDRENIRYLIYSYKLCIFTSDSLIKLIIAIKRRIIFITRE